MAVYELDQTAPTPATVRKLAGPVQSGITYVPQWVVKLPLTGGAENKIDSVENPFGVDVIIDEVILDLTTKSTVAAGVIDVDTVALATSTGDTILDGVAVGSGATDGTLTSSKILADSGTNGNEKPHRWNKAGGTNAFVTAKHLAAATTAVVAKLYIICHPAE